MFNKTDFKIFGLVVKFNHISGQQTNDNLLLNLLICKCVCYEKARHWELHLTRRAKETNACRAK